MINTVTLVGRITKDLELMATKDNKYCRFTLAVNRRGEDAADFITCIAWNKTAENLCTYMGKGSLIGVVGRITTGSYENRQGQRVYTTEVSAREVTFLEKRNQADQTNDYVKDRFDIDSEDLPF